MQLLAIKKPKQESLPFNLRGPRTTRCPCFCAEKIKLEWGVCVISGWMVREGSTVFLQLLLQGLLCSPSLPYCLQYPCPRSSSCCCTEEIHPECKSYNRLNQDTKTLLAAFFKKRWAGTNARIPPTT